MLALVICATSSVTYSPYKFFRGIIAGVIFGVLGIAYASSEPCPTQCAAGKVLLGVVVPTSGQASASAFGAQSIKPVEIAVRELNAAGGVLGIPVELAIGDDRCEPGLAIDVAHRQIDQDRDQLCHRSHLSGFRNGYRADLFQGWCYSILADRDGCNARDHTDDP